MIIIVITMNSQLPGSFSNESLTTHTYYKIALHFIIV